MQKTLKTIEKVETQKKQKKGVNSWKKRRKTCGKVWTICKKEVTWMEIGKKARQNRKEKTTRGNH